MLIEQGEREFLIELDKLIGVGHDLCLQGTLRMSGVERVAYAAVQLVVTHHAGELASVEKVDQLVEQACLRERKQRIHELPTRLTQLNEVTRVRLPQLVVLQHPRAVLGSDYVAKARCLHQVAQIEIEGQSEDHLARIKHQVGHRPASTGQQFAPVFERLVLPALHAIVDQRVVHVVANGLDGTKVQRAVRIYPPRCRSFIGSDIPILPALKTKGRWHLQWVPSAFPYMALRCGQLPWSKIGLRGAFHIGTGGWLARCCHGGGAITGVRRLEIEDYRFARG